MKPYKSMQLLSTLNFKPPLHKRKAPPSAQTQSLLIEDFLATVLREIIRFMKVALWL